MATLTVRDVPDDVYEALKALAERNRRSLTQQVVVLLEQVRSLPSRPPSERAAELRRRLAGRALGDTVQELRREREREP